MNRFTSIKRLAFAVMCLPWVVFPMLNFVLAQVGLIAIESPPGPEVVNMLTQDRETLVAGCEDVQHQMPAYPRPYPEYFPDWLDEDHFPKLAAMSWAADFVLPPSAESFRYTARELLRLAARRSRRVGSDLAADNLEHFLNNSGETKTDFNVEGLLRDLPVLDGLVRQTLESSASALVEQGLAESTSEPCRQLSSTTQPWIVTGLGGNPSTMPNIHIDATPFSSTFDLLYMHPDYEFRDELDVWMGMDPTWYAIGESVIVNTDTQQAELCYQVFIYFPYRWYNAGFVDRIMGLADGLRVAEHYDLEGTSGVTCEALP